LLNGPAINSEGRPYFVRKTQKKKSLDEIQKIIPEKEQQMIRAVEAGMNPKVLNAIKEAKIVKGKPDFSVGLQKDEAIAAEKKAVETLTKIIQKKEIGIVDPKSICNDNDNQKTPKSEKTFYFQQPTLECLDLESNGDFYNIEKSAMTIPLDSSKTALVYANFNGESRGAKETNFDF